MALKIVFLMVISLTCFMHNANTLPIKRLPINPKFDLPQRLEQNTGGMVECWNALMELRSCSNEIIIFFLNGQTDIGPGCCKAINVITSHCWSSMLTSLGYTAEEGNMLVGYCDASSSGAGPVASPPAPASVVVNA